MTLNAFLKVLRRHDGRISFVDLRKMYSGYHTAALCAVEQRLAKWTVYDDGTGGIKLVDDPAETVQ